MKVLARRDLQALLSALETLNSDIAPETLPERTLSAVRRIIPSEIAAFDGFNPDGTHTGEGWYDSPLEQKDLEVFASLMYEHPLLTALFSEYRTDPIRTTDFMSMEKFCRSSLYNEFYHVVGVDRQLVVGLHDAPGHIYTCAFNRWHADFSDRERDMLGVLAPHLKHSIQSANRIKQLRRQNESLETALGGISRGVIVAGGDRKLQFVSAGAEAFLAKYFDAEKSEPRRQRLPDALERWTADCLSRQKSEEALDLPAPLRIKRADGELQISFSHNSATGETILILEEKTELTPASFERIGLTRRESEVLFWMTCGKTNIEIGQLCGISWRTVQKHLEHIYIKLGVETRTAAAMLALEKLNFLSGH